MLSKEPDRKNNNKRQDKALNERDNVSHGKPCLIELFQLIPRFKLRPCAGNSAILTIEVLF